MSVSHTAQRSFLRAASKTRSALSVFTPRAVVARFSSTEAPPVRTCSHCGQAGHGAHQCPTNPMAGHCLRCGQKGHTANTCRAAGLATEKRVARCHNCGQPGHMMDACTHKARVCFLCHEPGHIAMQCPKAVKKPLGAAE